MYPLNLVALVIGIVLVIPRIFAVIWPSKMAIVCDKTLDSLLILRGLGIILLAASIYILYLILKKSNLLEIIMIIIGVGWLGLGAYTILKPQAYQKCGKYLVARSEFTFRLLSLLVLIFGVFLIVLAITSKGRI